MNSVARFLEGRGLVAEALEVATDSDYRFVLINASICITQGQICAVDILRSCCGTALPCSVPAWGARPS